MAQSDDPTQNSRQNGGRANGEFRTLGMSLLNSAHRHIRRYSASTNQPVTPLPPSWRSAASEPLVWSPGSSAAPEQPMPPSVDPVETFLMQQASVPTDVSVSAADPAAVQREIAPPAPAESPAPPASSAEPVSPVPPRMTIEQQLLYRLKVHEERLARKAAEEALPPPDSQSLFSEEAIRERLSPTPKPANQPNISRDAEPGVTRPTVRRRGAIIEVTPPVKQPFEEMDWENNSGEENFAEDRAQPSASATENTPSPSREAPLAQRQASPATSPIEAVTNTESPDAGETSPVPLENSDSYSSPSIDLRDDQIARETTEGSASPPVLRFTANESPQHEASSPEAASEAKIATRSTAPPQIESAAASDTDVARMPDEDIHTDPFEDRAAFAVEAPAESGMDSAARLTPASFAHQPAGFVPSESTSIPSSSSPASTPAMSIQRKAALDSSSKQSAPDENTAAQNPPVSAPDAQATAQPEVASGFSPAAGIQRQSISDALSASPDTANRSASVENTAAQSGSSGVPATQASLQPEVASDFPSTAGIQRQPVTDAPSTSPDGVNRSPSDENTAAQNPPVSIPAAQAPVQPEAASGLSPTSGIQRRSISDAPSTLADENVASQAPIQTEVASGLSPAAQIQRQPAPDATSTSPDTANRSPSVESTGGQSRPVAPVQPEATSGLSPIAGIQRQLIQGAPVSAESVAAQSRPVNVPTAQAPVQPEAASGLSHAAQIQRQPIPDATSTSPDTVNRSPSAENAVAQSGSVSADAAQVSIQPEVVSSLSPAAQIQRKPTPDVPSASRDAVNRSTSIEDVAAQSHSDSVPVAQAPVQSEATSGLSPTSGIQRQPTSDPSSVSSNDTALERASFDAPVPPVSNEQTPSGAEHVPPVVDVSQQPSQAVQRDISGEPIATTPVQAFEANRSLDSTASAVVAPGTASMTGSESPSVPPQTRSTEPVSPVIQRQSTAIPSDAPVERSVTDTLSTADTAGQQRLQRENVPHADPPAPEMSRQPGLGSSEHIQRSESEPQTSPLETIPPLPAAPKNEGVDEAAKPADDRSSPASDLPLQIQREIASKTTQGASPDVAQGNNSILPADNTAKTVPNPIPPAVNIPSSLGEGQAVQRVAASPSIPNATDGAIPPVAPIPPEATTSLRSEAATSSASEVVQRVAASETIPDVLNVLIPPSAPEVRMSVADDAARTSPTSTAVPPASEAIQRVTASETIPDVGNVPENTAVPSASEVIQRVAASKPISAAPNISIPPSATDAPQGVQRLGSEDATGNIPESTAVPLASEAIQRVAASKPISDTLNISVPPSATDAPQGVQRSSTDDATGNVPESAAVPPASEVIRRVAASETIPDVPSLVVPPATSAPSEVIISRHTDNTVRDIPEGTIASTAPENVQRRASNEKIVDAPDVPTSPVSTSTPVFTQPTVLNNPPVVQRAAKSDAISSDPLTIPPAVQFMSPDQAQESAVPASPSPERAVPPASIRPAVVQRAPSNEAAESAAPREQDAKFQNPAANQSVPPNEAAISTQPVTDTTSIKRSVQTTATPPGEEPASLIPEPSPVKAAVPGTIQRRSSLVTELPSDTAAPTRPSPLPESASALTPNTTSSAQRQISDSDSRIQREASGSPDVAPMESPTQINEMDVFEALLSIGAVKPITATGNTVRRQNDIYRAPEPSNTTQNSLANSDIEKTVYEPDSPEADLLRLLDLSPDTPVVRRKQSAGVPPSEIFTTRSQPESDTAGGVFKSFDYQGQIRQSTPPLIQRSPETASRSSVDKQVSFPETTLSQPLIQRTERPAAIQREQTLYTDVVEEMNQSNPTEDKGIDIEELSRQVYQMLRLQLRVERERRGRS